MADSSRPYHLNTDAAQQLILWARVTASDRQQEWERTQALAARLADAERVLDASGAVWERGHYCTGSGNRRTQVCGCG